MHHRVHEGEHLAAYPVPYFKVLSENKAA